MNIVDAHAHLGTCRIFGLNQTGEQLISAMDGAGIETAIVQPFPGPPDAAAAHDAIAELATQHPGRIVGMASLNPHQDPDDYRNEVRRCVEELNFVAVKVHTIGHAIRPGSEDADLIFSTASDLGIAVMVHTGPGVPFAEPASWVPLALKYPDTPVILGHAGASLYIGPAIVAARMCTNIVLETSWSNPQNIRNAIEVLGAEKVLFGSDMAFNVKVEMAKYDALDLSDSQRDLVFTKNAEAVYALATSGSR